MSRKVRIERNVNPKLTPELVQGYSSDINRDLDMRKDVINVRRENLVALSDEAFEQVRWYTWLPHSIENEQTGTLCLYEASLMRAFYHQLAMRPDEPQSIQLPGYPEVIWKGEGILKTGCLHPNRWLDAYFTSVIVRDKPGMDLLANFPISLMKQSATKAGELSYMLVDVIQSFHNRTSDYPDKLVAAMDAAIAQGDDWALEIAMGILETFAALTTDIGYDFEEVLIKNLQFQEQYQMRLDAPKKLISIETFISFPLLGMACMWYDKGNCLSVETGWLPPYLVEGRWLEDVKVGKITR
ncbi:immunity 49 family protein [Vibrio parahaemolyticus]|uniref:immunity 49 family protein n=1 Tax=Vibrio parahaemolyticus TaxID=670 RepID=UPI0009F1072D|nr:immunity 49 family protein [Vibrio parahaemolyticus]EJG0621626.1 immunity 49 family protein [Vibrio parahaemolyticus]EJG0638907.1 immunity 49 family protein [Vibrio parahaemolyticus]EJG0685879.1 immunity 49 family protein [Vibrio parahaemolyticus]EJG0700695.1 immunity 49 family protein [Vibrio parahaemolyticus]EJG0729209.1 immunity 49 family protein [Vibrio parahaemolyticus]